MTSARILVVEDDRVVARDIQHQLTRIGHTVVGVTQSGEDAVRLALESHPDLVLMDIRLEGALDGVDAAQQIRDRCQVPVVYLTAYADDETLKRARVTEPFGYLLKPFEDSQLRTVIEMALYKHTAERKLRESERRYAVTLASIGDAVIATDGQARVTFLNPVAEALTGWPQAEAAGRPLAEVFHIVNEETRQPVEDPAAKVLRLGTVVGLANHTVLMARDGREVPIDDCGAPIVDDRGRITGVVLVFRDTTQRRQAEEAAVLRKAHSRLELAVRGSNLGIWEHDMPDGRLDDSRATFINVWESLGYDPLTSPTDFAAGLAFATHPEDQGRVTRAIQACLNGETRELDVEVRVRHRDGSDRWHLARRGGARRRGPTHSLPGQQRRYHRAQAGRGGAAHSEQRFRTFVDHATDAFFLFDDRLVVVDVNRQACLSLGYTRDELVGMTPLDFDPDVTPALLEEFGRRLDTGEMLVFESRHRRKDGSVFPVEVRGRPFREGGRRLTVALARDITEHKRFEESLRESEAWFRFLANAMPQIVWTARPDGSLEYLNDRFVEYTGVTVAEGIGERWLAVLHPDDRERAMTRWMADVAGGSVHDREWRLRATDGRYRWFKARGLPVRDESGQIFKWVGTLTDIDDQKRAEEALREAKDSAESANRAKDEFLANVSHEIRTPMNAILGMTELVLETRLTDDQRQCLSTVKSAADNLLGIINDLLDFSKIEAGKLELEPADFSLRAALGDTLRTLAMRAHRKGLELIYDVQPDVPDALVGDAGRLRQVWLNLVGNAIKFTEEGEVVVRAEVAGEPAPGEVSVRFAVSDTGIGIPPDKQEKVFRAFEQEDTSTTRRYGGTGLGLSIAARLVALMGGTIAVRSEPGRGSTFAFTAQFGRQPHPTETTPAPPPVLLRDLRVLVVDDNATNRHILEEWLRDWQMSPTAVGDGVAAMDVLWDAASAGRPYPLVLLDARMPQTDGLALAARIRERAALAAIRIILLTSGDRPGDPARSREVRIDAHLLKPVQPDELLETIYRVMNGARGGAPPAAEPAPALEPDPEAAPAMTRLHILVAEDNEWSARFLERLLTRPGHRVQLATDGREALAMAEQKGFDLLLLDVHMPELDGFQVVQALRERERTAGGHLPIIALTARSRKEDRERCLAAGMDDFLTKPIRPAELLAAIDRLVRAPGGSHGVSPPGSRDIEERRHLLDPVALLTACGDDAEWLRGMCQDFQTYVPARLAEMGEALRDRDASRLREEAHKLCALLSAFSTAAGDVASDLEDHAAQGRLEEARPLVDQLEAMARELLGLTGGLSLETLRHQAEATGDRELTVGSGHKRPRTRDGSEQPGKA